MHFVQNNKYEGEVDVEVECRRINIETTKAIDRLNRK